MAKKSMIDDIKTAIIETVKSHFTSKLKEHFEDLVDKAHDTIVITHKKVMRSIVAIALFLLGILFVIVGGTFVLTDVFKYDRSMVYLTIGIVLLLVSTILAQSARLLKYHLKV